MASKLNDILPVWHDGLTIIDPDDPVQGGVDGIDNQPHIELMQNDIWLKSELAKALERITKLEGGTTTPTTTTTPPTTTTTPPPTSTYVRPTDAIDTISVVANPNPISRTGTTTYTFTTSPAVTRDISIDIWQFTKDASTLSSTNGNWGSANMNDNADLSVYRVNILNGVGTLTVGLKVDPDLYPNISITPRTERFDDGVINPSSGQYLLRVSPEEFIIN